MPGTVLMLSTLLQIGSLEAETEAGILVQVFPEGMDAQRRRECGSRMRRAKSAK